MVSALMHEDAAEVERVEIIRLRIQGLTVEFLRLVQATKPMERGGFSQRFANSSRFGVGVDVRLGHWLDDVPNSVRTRHHLASVIASESDERLFVGGPFVQAGLCGCQPGIGIGPMSFGTRYPF